MTSRIEVVNEETAQQLYVLMNSGNCNIVKLLVSNTKVAINVQPQLSKKLEAYYVKERERRIEKISTRNHHGRSV